MNTLDYITFLLLIVLSIQVFRIRAFKIVPWFAAYVWYAVLASIPRFVVGYETDAYITTYWITEAGYVLLALAALYEVYRTVFSGLTRTWWFRIIVSFIMVTTLLFVAMRTYKFPPRTSSHLAAAIITSELAVRLLQGLMCVTLVPTLAIFPQRWKQYPLGVAAGFGFYAMVHLLATTHFSDFVKTFTNVWGRILVSAYSVTVVIWLWYFRKPQSDDPGDPNISLIEAHEEIDKYRSFLRRL